MSSLGYTAVSHIQHTSVIVCIHP